MNTLVNLLKTKTPNQEVKSQILSMIQVWGLRFQSGKDILPNFNDTYINLKTQGFPFSDEPSVQQQYLESSGDPAWPAQQGDRQEGIKMT